MSIPGLDNWCPSQHYIQGVICFFFYFRPFKWCRCTVACKGVVKSAKYCSIQLCHLICPRNRLRAFTVFDADASIIALIFLGTMAMPWLLTIQPNSVPLVTLNAHFAGLRLNRAPLHFFRHCQRWLRWVPLVLYTTKSSKNTCMNISIHSLNLSMMIRWNVAGVVPQGMPKVLPFLW